MYQRSETYKKWDDLCRSLQPAKKEYAQKVIARVREVFGDDLTLDATIRYATLACLDPAFEVSMELAHTDSKVHKKHAV